MGGQACGKIVNKYQSFDLGACALAKSQQLLPTNSAIHQWGQKCNVRYTVMFIWQRTKMAL
jgi:hypothetical protein